MIQYTLSRALGTLSPVPTVEALLALNSSVVVGVASAQRGAPDITRIVLFRGDRELAPGKSTLAPRMFTNGSVHDLVLVSQLALLNFHARR